MSWWELWDSTTTVKLKLKPNEIQRAKKLIIVQCHVNINMFIRSTLNSNFCISFLSLYNSLRNVQYQWNIWTHFLVQAKGKDASKLLNCTLYSCQVATPEKTQVKSDEYLLKILHMKSRLESLYRARPAVWLCWFYHSSAQKEMSYTFPVGWYKRCHRCPTGWSQWPHPLIRQGIQCELLQLYKPQLHSGDHIHFMACCMNPCGLMESSILQTERNWVILYWYYWVRLCQCTQYVCNILYLYAFTNIRLSFDSTQIIRMMSLWVNLWLHSHFSVISQTFGAFFVLWFCLFDVFSPRMWWHPGTWMRDERGWHRHVCKRSLLSALVCVVPLSVLTAAYFKAHLQ